MIPTRQCLLLGANEVHALYDYTICSNVQTKYHLNTKSALYQQVTNSHIHIHFIYLNQVFILRLFLQN